MIVDEVIEWFGNQSNMARALNVNRSAVNQWRRAGGMPAKRALQVERLSGGKFRAVDIPEVQRAQV